MEWIAIVNFEQDHGPRAVVMMDEELENVLMYSSPDAIERVRDKHMLKSFDWFAFNVTTGEVLEL